MIQPRGHKRRGRLFSVSCLWRKAVIFASCLIWKKLVYHFYPQVTNNRFGVLRRGTQVNLEGVTDHQRPSSVFLSLKLKSLEPSSKQFNSGSRENESAFFRGTQIWLSSAGPTRLDQHVCHLLYMWFSLASVCGVQEC